MTEEIEIRPCKSCGLDTPHTIWISPVNGRRMFEDAPTYCEECSTRLRAEEEAKEKAEKVAQRLAALTVKWEGICPPLYRHTELGHPKISRKVWDALKAWEPDGVQGLGIIGETGCGKTRLAYMRLRELHFLGHEVYAVSAKRVERAIQDTFSDDDDTRSDARKTVNEATYKRILLLDDLGKEKYTERVASEFYALVEERTSEMLPTIWTANTSATELTRRMGAEHGSATVRRLMEFSTIITV